MDIRIYLTNLAKYNEGNLVGKWLNLPMSENVLHNELKKIIGTDEEFFITDYDAPFEIHEYDNLSELNKFAEQFDGLEEYDQEKVNFLLSTIGTSRDEVFDQIEEVVFYQGMTLINVAEQFIEEKLFGEIPEAVMHYIDYERIARDLSFDGYHETSKGTFYYQ